MRGLGAIGVVIFLVPAMIYGAMQMQIMLKVNSVINEALTVETHGDRITEAVVAESGEIPFSIIGSRGQTLEPGQAAALLAPNTLNRKRAARVSTIVDPATLLAPGETMPGGDLRDILVEARTAAYADALCDQLIATIANQCGVVSYSVDEITFDPDKDAPDWADAFAGRYVVETHAIFTPSTPVGSFPVADSLVLHSKEFDLDAWTAPGPSPEAFAARLGEVLLAAERACAEMRRIHGNCVVEDIDFDISRHQPDRVRPSFELGYFSRLQTTASVE